MAAVKVVCTARLLFGSEIRSVYYYSALVNNCLLNKMWLNLHEDQSEYNLVACTITFTKKKLIYIYCASCTTEFGLKFEMPSSNLTGLPATWKSQEITTDSWTNNFLIRNATLADAKRKLKLHISIHSVVKKGKTIEKAKKKALKRNHLYIPHKYKNYNVKRVIQYGHLRKVRQCRQLSVSIPLRDQSKDKLKETKQHVSSSSSSSSSDSEQDEDDVVIEFCHGLPQMIVPLPSRKEKCKFTLRPISNTVGDFLEMLKTEDKGIDRAVIHSTDGTRIASSNTIDTLLHDSFKLIINDNEYSVKIPEYYRVTSDELKAFDDVKTIISQLYEILHVEDFHVQKENDLTIQLEALKQEIQPLEEQRLQIEMTAERKNNWLSWVGLGLMSIQFGILARLTWWEYSWDIMEPVTYFVTYGTAMAAYAYFVVTKEEYILQDVKNRQHLLTMHKKSKKLGLDLLKYNQLRDQISNLELELLKSKSKFRKSHLSKKPSTEIDNKNN